MSDGTARGPARRATSRRRARWRAPAGRRPGRGDRPRAGPPAPWPRPSPASSGDRRRSGDARAPGRARRAPPLPGCATSSAPSPERSVRRVRSPAGRRRRRRRRPAAVRRGAPRRARCSATCSPRPPRGCPSGTRARLRQAYPGASDEEIADALVARAARMTAGIGAATGGLSAAHWFAPPSLLALPLELGRRDRADRRRRGGADRGAARAVRPTGRPATPARARPPTWRAGRSSGRSTAPATAGLGSLLGTCRHARAAPAGDPRKLAGDDPHAPRRSCSVRPLADRGNRRATEALAERIRSICGSGRSTPDS